MQRMRRARAGRGAAVTPRPHDDHFGLLASGEALAQTPGTQAANAPREAAARRKRERTLRLLAFLPLFELRSPEQRGGPQHADAAGTPNLVSRNRCENVSGDKLPIDAPPRHDEENSESNRAPSPDGATDTAFMALLSEEGWLLALDWRSWPRGEEYLRRPEAIAEADAEDLRRLLTLFAGRTEAEAGFLSVPATRHAVAAALRRLRELELDAGR